MLCIVGGALALLSAFSKFEEVLPSLVAGGLALASGLLLRQLSPVGRILYTVLAVVGLLANAFTAATAPHPLVYLVAGVQTAVAGLYLWLLWNRAASPVFGAAYRREVVPATPHVKPVSSPLVVGAFIGAIVVTAAGTAAVVATLL